MDCIYVFVSLLYAFIGTLYGYLGWRLLEVVDKYAGKLDT